MGKFDGHEAVSPRAPRIPLYLLLTPRLMLNKKENSTSWNYLSWESPFGNSPNFLVEGTFILNVSASLFGVARSSICMTLAILMRLGLDQIRQLRYRAVPTKPPYDNNGLPRSSVDHYREMGFQVAIMIRRWLSGLQALVKSYKARYCKMISTY